MNFKKITIIVFALIYLVAAKSRWSATQIIPNADFIGAGEVHLGYRFALGGDTSGAIETASIIPINIGISEWMTLSLSWADGFSAGFKGRLLDEYSTYMPSLAIGVRELYTNTQLTQAFIAENDTSAVTSELYLALGKTVQTIATRFHGGITSLPNAEGEEINTFIGIEKKLNDDIYLTLEGWGLEDRFNIALFGSFRFMKQKQAQLSVGLVDLEHMLFSSDGVGLTLNPESNSDWVKPAITAQFTYSFPFSFGSQAQFRTVENLYSEQQNHISILESRFDSLSLRQVESKIREDSLTTMLDSVVRIIESGDTLPDHYAEIYAKLVAYDIAYRAEPFEPKSVRRIGKEIVGYDEDAVDVLKIVLRRKGEPRRIKRHAVTLLGEMQVFDIVPFLLDILAETRDSRIKIQVISTLGKIGDQSASYALKHLAESSDEGVAIAAAEVLLLWKENRAQEKNLSQDSEFIVESTEIESKEPKKEPTNSDDKGKTDD